MNLQQLMIRIGSVLAIVGSLVISGCNVIGPQAISGGRAVYAEVINRTEDEEILNIIVRMRYDETFGMISVASVTANLRFAAQAGTNIGVGSSDNYAGNLVPLSGGVAYEESPTISYVPLSGEDFMRRMISPVPLNQWLLLTAPSKHPGHVLDLAVRRINGLKNPLLDEKPSPEFARFLVLYRRLREAGVLDIFYGSGTVQGFFWEFNNYADAHMDSVREILDLLGIDVKPTGSAITLPLRVAHGNSTDAIQVQLRSVYDVLRVFGSGIEIPSAHLESGIVEPIDWPVPEQRRFITIHSAEKSWWSSRPSVASVAIQFQDRWFYIDATDNRSKKAFMWLRTFIGMRLADPKAMNQVPLLTVPVK